MGLKTDYKDDILPAGQDREYTITETSSGSGKYKINDVSPYTQVGDNFAAADMNATNTAINKLNSSSNATLTTTWTLDSTSNKYYQDITITGITADDVIDIYPITKDLTKAQEATYLNNFNKLCSNCETISGALRVYSNVSIATEITVELRLVK